MLNANQNTWPSWLAQHEFQKYAVLLNVIVILYSYPIRITQISAAQVGKDVQQLFIFYKAVYKAFHQRHIAASSFDLYTYTPVTSFIRLSGD